MRRFVKIGGKFFLSAEKTLRDSLGNSKMTTLEHDFIEFALKARVLRFGEFKTKAGRLSPYFFNAGLFNTGSLLDRLGAFYAKKILEKRESGELQFDMLFGPAYKGIPLVASIAINLSRLGLDLPWAFNRKEKKDHGEGGTIIGSPLTGRVLIVDDVISAGTSIRESIAIIRDNGALSRLTAWRRAATLRRSLRPPLFRMWKRLSRFLSCRSRTSRTCLNS